MCVRQSIPRGPLFTVNTIHVPPVLSQQYLVNTIPRLITAVPGSWNLIHNNDIAVEHTQSAFSHISMTCFPPVIVCLTLGDCVFDTRWLCVWHSVIVCLTLGDRVFDTRWVCVWHLVIMCSTLLCVVLHSKLTIFVQSHNYCVSKYQYDHPLLWGIYHNVTRYIIVDSRLWPKS